MHTSMPRHACQGGFVSSVTEFVKNRAPGPNPTKLDFPNFALICKIFVQICVNFFTIFLQNLQVYVQVMAQNEKKMSYHTTLIKSNKNVYCASYKYFVMTSICKPIFVFFCRIGTWSWAGHRKSSGPARSWRKRGAVPTSAAVLAAQVRGGGGMAVGTLTAAEINFKMLICLTSTAAEINFKMLFFYFLSLRSLSCMAVGTLTAAEINFKMLICLTSTAAEINFKMLFFTFSL
jgi:hypothetical protein